MNSDATPAADGQNHAAEAITVTPFAASRLGLVPGQTALKINNLLIACMPYRLSMEGAVLIGAFSSKEFAHFQRYVGSLVGLNLALQPSNSPQPVKIFARCAVKAISPMPGREAVGMISVGWRPCPPDMKLAVENYLGMMQRLRAEYDDFKGKTVKIDAAAAGAMGYNNYAELSLGAAQVKVAVFALASDRLDFLLPVNAAAPAEGDEASVKLYFRSERFSVNGTVAQSVPLPSGARKVALSLRFSPELVDILERYWMSGRLAAARADRQAEG